MKVHSSDCAAEKLYETRERQQWGTERLEALTKTNVV